MDQNIYFHVTNSNMLGTYMYWKMISKDKLVNLNYYLSLNIIMSLFPHAI